MAEPEDGNNRRPDGQEAVPTADYGGAAVGPGAQIGPYKLVSILGEGGYGLVYLAEQQRPVKRRVALKIIKPGMDSKQVIARFEAERQALALLDHPNIAHVFNAGTTEAGRPYFVMEHVKGIPITEHCDRHKLTIGERLKLFLQVCEAVQYAHQKGIIHRDIKPSNILVTLEAERSTPMIIDFGVAKAISQPLTERTLVTEQGQFVGTPEYMSPEQADLTSQDIDTRSDIYSLGVVLYELLTGALPFDPEALRKGGIDHIRHMIREAEPKTPSTRLSTITGQESTKLAQLRRTDARTLGRQLHGDLDWITLKAMEKDQTRRYQTAHALAEDIQRHLDNEPVLAGPPSRIYRLKKFVQKHRTQAIGAAVAGILLAVIVAILVLYIQAANRSKEAESLKHQAILSKAAEYHSKGQYEGALAELGPILDSQHVGPQARLLRAQITLKLQGPAEAIGQLEELIEERDEIACQAHFLLARVYLETDPNDPNDVATYRLKGKEHQKKGEELFLESPEAYYNRSMMAGTVDKSLEYLSEALKIDSGHYPSLQARALGYYALRDYRRMERDAAAMTALRGWDPQGHSLLAIALRETGDLTDAVRHHNRAIEIRPRDAELYDQRRQTYANLGTHEQVLSDARTCVRLQPSNTLYQFHVFSALVALGRCAEAQAKYEEIFHAPLESRRRFRELSRKYTFDVLSAGQSWHAPENRPTGIAFLSMIEAEEDYRRLAGKGATRIVPEGYWPSWSPDGTELVYSRGIVGYSGIEIVNLNTRNTRLLTVPGCDPAWSPDGLYIAFVREGQTLLLADLTAGHNEWRGSSRDQREIWTIRADGTEEPRFLTKGDFPSWSQDSQRVFYYARDSMKVCSISREEGAEPVEIAWCPNPCPVLSPDEKSIAYKSVSSTRVHVEDIFSRAPIATGTGLPPILFFLNWSPDGRQLSTGAWGGSEGLWMYDRETGEASRILSGSVPMGRWSPDGRRMVFTSLLQPAEVWVVDTESLGPGLTLREHHQEMVERFTRRIDADPEDAQAYHERAESYVYLGDREKALRDFEKHADIVREPSQAAWAYDRTAWPLVSAHQEVVDPEIAVELYRQAHELLPEDWRCLCGLGAACYRAGRWSEAIAELIKSTELTGGENSFNYFFLAMAYSQVGDQVVAEGWYNQAIESLAGGNLDWLGASGYRLCDVYLEATELMGTKLREFRRK